MKSIAQVTSVGLASFGVSEVVIIPWLQITVLLSSLAFSMFKLWLEYKRKK